MGSRLQQNGQYTELMPINKACPLLMYGVVEIDTVSLIVSYLLSADVKQSLKNIGIVT